MPSAVMYARYATHRQTVGELRRPTSEPAHRQKFFLQYGASGRVPHEVSPLTTLVFELLQIRLH